MATSSLNLPYFDFLLQEFNQGNRDTETALGRHVHWGYWENPQLAKKTLKDFQIATENLTKLIAALAQIEDGMRILDVGCGFGGTIASLNERFSDLQLVGVNLDSRQLERARKLVIPSNNNQIEFVCANACELPFEAESFDVVLAVECIFHFPSRDSFFQQVNRVLKPQGKFTLSDFVLSDNQHNFSSGLRNIVSSFIAQFYGKATCCTRGDYKQLSENHNFKAIASLDITKETLPTYDFLLTLFPVSKPKYFKAYWTTQLLKLSQSSRSIIYQVLAYQSLS